MISVPAVIKPMVSSKLLPNTAIAEEVFDNAVLKSFVPTAKLLAVWLFYVNFNSVIIKANLFNCSCFHMRTDHIFLSYDKLGRFHNQPNYVLYSLRLLM